jgi:hypothetical protein
MSRSRSWQLMSPGPRHLALSPWPWRPGLVAFVGGYPAVPAALVALATRSPPPSPLRRVSALMLQAVQADPAARSVSTSTTGPRASTTAPTLSTPISDTVPPALSRPTTCPGLARAQAPATAARTMITEALSTVGATHHPTPGDHPNYHDRACHHGRARDHGGTQPAPSPPRPSRPPPGRRSLYPLAGVGQQTGSDPRRRRCHERVPTSRGVWAG